MRHQANGREWSSVVTEAVDYCQRHGLGVLIVDTWDKWTGLKGDAENNAGASLEALEPLIGAAGSGLAVLICAHQRKSFGEFGEAVRRSNPACDPRVRKPKQVREEPQPPSGEHLLAILEAMGECWRLLFVTIERGALRLGEAVSLRWADVDAANLRLRLPRSATKRDKARWVLPARLAHGDD
jgi:hypothetical protein